MSVPNQRIIRIEKPSYTSNFLQIGIEEWQNAARVLSPSSFKVYLYLASNANGYNLELSQKAVENAVGVKKTSYHDAINQLRDLGFIYTLQGNIDIFTPSPKKRKSPEIRSESGNSESENPENLVRKSELKSPENRTVESGNPDDLVRKTGREIDNKYINNINKTNKEKGLEEMAKEIEKAAPAFNDEQNAILDALLDDLRAAANNEEKLMFMSLAHEAIFNTTIVV